MSANLISMAEAYDNSAEAIQMLVLERVDSTCNMARYYVLSIEPTLFGDTAMIREWGRIGHSVNRRVELYAQATDARVALDDWFRRKLKRGYIKR